MTETLSRKGIIKYNRSTTYLLPLIDKSINLDFSHLVMNCYIAFNKDIGDIKYPFGIVYDVSGFPSYEVFSEYDNRLKSSDLFYSSHIVNDDFRLYIFNFPIEYTAEYIHFKEGRYSKFSDESKQVLLKYTMLTYKYQPLTEDMVGILWKRKDRKQKLEALLDMNIPDDVELTSKIVIEEETFKFLV